MPQTKPLTHLPSAAGLIYELLACGRLASAVPTGNGSWLVRRTHTGRTTTLKDYQDVLAFVVDTLDFVHAQVKEAAA